MLRQKKTMWLFAFTDLAFLLLISLSLIPSAPADISLRFAEMNLPVVPDSRSLQPMREQQESWELQIFAVGAEHPFPFRLVRTGEKEGLSLNEGNLIPALERLRDSRARPVLLPEKTSLSQDLLFAAAAMAKVWSAADSRSIVRPVDTGAPE